MLTALGIMVACEKAFLPENEKSKGTQGNLTVNVFEIEKTPFEIFTRAEKDATEAVTRLNFAIYNIDGTRAKQVNQTSDDTNFGTASFQLEEGDYVLVVVGHSSDGNPTMTDPTAIKFTNAQGYTDTFIYSTVITIGDEPVEKQVSLKRIVSLCRFVITDDYPAEVKKMRFYYTGGSGAFDATTGFGCVNSKQEVKFDVTPTLKQFDLYTFLHDVEGIIHLTVSALDASGNELYSREFDVPMQQNYITSLTGDFFTGGGSSSSANTRVMIDTDWAGETRLTF